MNSMTGFGKAEVSTRFGKLTVEISSVNNRFLEITQRLPRSLTAFEPRLRDLVTSKISRGKVSLYVGFDENDSASGSYSINVDAVKAYHRQLTRLARQLKIKDTVTVRDLLLLPDVAAPKQKDLDERLVWNNLQRTTRKALVELVKMRRKEGLAMARDMTRRIQALGRDAARIKGRAGVAVDAYRKKLTRRLDELLESPVPDYVKIEEQIALMAEKTDISEECTRFMSHINQYRTAMKEGRPVGKKLNFILQELNREANTIASKSTDSRISSLVIGVKEEIEKIRELVQNVE
ncbi:MAG: YicC family protein [Candidatus Zixiibacteriota bacterium]|nr:MAG: YicC family protein [candidate division Zixibacteria bacterium]